MEYLNIDPSELELVKHCPKPKINNNSLQAQRRCSLTFQRSLKRICNPMIVREGFKKIIISSTKTKEKNPNGLWKCPKAKKEFTNWIPGWYGEEADKGRNLHRLKK